MKRITLTMCALGALAACAEPPPPPSVAEFLEDPILLEATMVRCGENRAVSRYDGECMNARSAVDQLAAAAKETRRKALEAESERKRQALRRAQEAAAEARRRMAEEARHREEVANFGQFEPLPPDRQPEAAGPASIAGSQGPIADGIPAASAPAPEALTVPDAAPAPADAHVPAGAPAGDSSAPPAPAATTGAAAAPGFTGGADLDAVRQELERRQDEAEQQE